MLYIIGLGLWDKKDISVKGLNAVKNADYVYFENYTSRLNCSIDELEVFYGKKVIPADREMIESKYGEILSRAEKGNVAVLVIGDVFSATTHINLLIEAREKGIGVEVIHNASVVSAVGITGLEVYKFGKITSIPFDNKNIESPVKALYDNKRLGLHTLFLLDLKPEENKFMRASDAAEYLISKGVKKDEKAVAIAGLGSESPEIVVDNLAKIAESENLKKIPQCIIVPGNLHFIEEKALKMWEKAA